MDRKSFVVVGGCLPLLACTVIPLAVFGLLCGQWGTNLVWGLIFGFGWWVAQSILGAEHWRVAVTIGLFVWLPIIVAGSVFVSRSVWRLGERARKLFLLVLGISCLPIVPAETAMALYANARVPPDFNVLANSW
jgi:hypothetical protein